MSAALGIVSSVTGFAAGMLAGRATDSVLVAMVVASAVATLTVAAGSRVVDR